MNVTISVVIRTKNEAKDIGKCLELITNQSVKPLDIIVVDSGSTDGTVEIVKQWQNVKLIEMPAAEFTFGRSLNIGFEAAKGDVVLSISAHAFPCDEYWLKNLGQHFNDSQVAGVYGRQLPQPDAWPPVQRDYLDFYKEQLRIQTNPDNLKDRIFSNANSAIRRQCWEKRKFDEQLTGSEDTEWAWAMLQLGYKIIYEPTAGVYHSHNEPLNKLFKRSYRESLANKQISNNERTLSNALIGWLSSTKADFKFIVTNKLDYRWFLWVPLYRFVAEYGEIKPYILFSFSNPLILWQSQPQSKSSNSSN
ncbi:MAG: glycosyltransferase [Richelia sp. RM1_1_1]|nr:glycosyltransferase [Richelia sp. RM1_1_1]